MAGIFDFITEAYGNRKCANQYQDPPPPLTPKMSYGDAYINNSLTFFFLGPPFFRSSRRSQVLHCSPHCPQSMILRLVLIILPQLSFFKLTWQPWQKYVGVIPSIVNISDVNPYALESISKCFSTSYRLSLSFKSFPHAKHKRQSASSWRASSARADVEICGKLECSIDDFGEMLTSYSGSSIDDSAELSAPYSGSSIDDFGEMLTSYSGSSIDEFCEMLTSSTTDDIGELLAPCSIRAWWNCQVSSLLFLFYSACVFTRRATQ